MSGREVDSRLRRLERRAAAACGAIAVVALIVRRGQPDVALGVLGGGLLVAVSYRTIKGTVDGLLAAPSREGGATIGRLVWLVLKFSARYALLGFLAYVMIARLRLHPVGLLAGASSLVLAAAAEAARTPSWSRSDDNP